MSEISWTAVCRYPGKDQFLFYSPEFVADWKELDDEARKVVDEAWSKISPHPAPPVIELVPGCMNFVPGKGSGSHYAIVVQA